MASGACSAASAALALGPSATATCPWWAPRAESRRVHACQAAAGSLEELVAFSPAPSLLLLLLSSSSSSPSPSSSTSSPPPPPSASATTSRSADDTRNSSGGTACLPSAAALARAFSTQSIPPTAAGAEGAGLFPPWEAATEADGTSAAAASSRRAAREEEEDVEAFEVPESMPWLPLPTPRISSRIGFSTALMPSSRAVARALVGVFFF